MTRVVGSILALTRRNPSVNRTAIRFTARTLGVALLLVGCAPKPDAPAAAGADPEKPQPTDQVRETEPPPPDDLNSVGVMTASISDVTLEPWSGEGDAITIDSFDFGSIDLWCCPG